MNAFFNVRDKETTVALIENAILGKCRFFLSEHEHIIAYNPYGKRIDPLAFRKAFTGIVLAADDSFDTDSIIYPINDEYEFLSFLKSMRTISTLSIQLTPSNPNTRHLWKGIDDKLNEMNTKTYNEKYVARKGQTLVIQEEEEAKIHMAEDGYGKATSDGVDQDGNEVTISTDNNGLTPIV